MNNYAIIGAGVSVCVLGVIAIGYNTNIVSNIRSRLGSNSMFSSNSNNPFRNSQTSLFGTRTNKGVGGTRKNKRL